MLDRGVEIGTIDDWVPDPGSVVSWQPSPAALAKAQRGADKRRARQLHAGAAPSWLSRTRSARRLR